MIAGDADQEHHGSLADLAHLEVALEPGDQLFVPGQRQLGFGFYLVRQSQHRQAQVGLRQCAHRFDASLPMGEEHGVEVFVRGQRANAYRGLGDQAQAAFRAHQRLAQIGPGTGGRQASDGDATTRGRQSRAMKQLLDAPIAQRLLAAGARHHPATHRGVLITLRKVAQQVTVRLELCIHHRARCARFEGGEPVARINVLEPVELLETQVDDRPIARRHIEMTHHAGATTPGNDHGPSLQSSGQRLIGLIRCGGQRDSIRHGADLAVAQRQPVGIALPPRVVESCGCVRDKRPAGQARSRHGGQHGIAAGIAVGGALADALPQKAPRFRRQRIVFVFLAPAVPAPHNHSLLIERAEYIQRPELQPWRGLLRNATERFERQAGLIHVAAQRGRRLAGFAQMIQHQTGANEIL